MAKDRRKLQHIHSSIADRQPTPSTLAVGEIAVNNADKKEFLSIKSSNDKVVRFSSDEQMITWMERKEVMPYKGYVKGRTANSTYGEDPGTGDSYNSYGITNDDLLENKSQIIIKLNQVAAENTGKYNKVNNAKDKYGNVINPWSGETIGDGAGFYIDMSRYAMNGANPIFSSLTVTDKTDLSGNTTITDGDGTGTRTGKTFTVNVTNENETVTTLKESATTRTTIIGTESLTVSGTTDETHNGNVTIVNNANKSETTDVNLTELVKGDNYRDVNGNYSGTTGGTTTEVKTDDVSETNLANIVVNTSGTTTYNNNGTTTTNESGNTVFNTTGNTTFMTTGNTAIHSEGAVGITAVRDITAASSEASIIITANDDLCATAGDIAAFVGTNKTNIGIDCSDGGQTQTLNIKANTANTVSTSAYTSATTATTVIGTLNESATTADYSGNTLNSHINSVTHSGDTLDITESTSTILKSPATTISGTSLTIDEGTSISAKTPTTTISGTNLNITEANTTISTCGKFEVTSDNFSVKQCSTTGGSVEFEFCNGFGVKSNAVNFEQCGDDGTFTIKEKTTNISGTTTNISGATNVRGATTISGSSLAVTAATNISGNLSVIGATNLNGNVCVTGTVTASQAIYSSDRDLKENIEEVDIDALNKVGWVDTKSYNFKGETNKLYGVIAQEVQEAGLDELVYTKEDGHLAVDYTSLMMLKIASLEKMYKELLDKTEILKDEIRFLKENKQ